MIAAAYAGFAGGLLGVLQAFMPPDAFTFDTSGQLVMQTAIGGRGTLFGPLVGAAVWLFLQDFLQATLDLGAAWKLVLGVVFVLLVCFLRRGIVGGLVDLYGLVSGKRARSGCRSRTAEAELDDAAASSALAPMPAQAGRARPRYSGPILQATRPDQALRRPRRQQRHRFHASITASCAASSARTAPARSTFFKMLTCEVAADLRQDRLRGPRHHRHERHRRLPARPDQELPGQPALQPA